MEKALYRLLNEERVRDFVLRGQKVHMVLLSAAATLLRTACTAVRRWRPGACASAERQYSKAPKKCCRR